MVEELGVRSYLGCPIRVSGVTLGSLCVVDAQARTFSAEDRRKVEAIAQDLSDTLEQLEDQQVRGAPATTLSRACAPAFGELRNLLAPLKCGLGHAAAASAELKCALRALRLKDPAERARFEGLLEETMNAAEDVAEVLAEVNGVSNRLTDQLGSLEVLLASPAAKVDLTDALQHACTVALHLTKLVGGVRLGGEAATAKDPVENRLTAMVAAMLALCAKDLSAARAASGISLHCTRVPGAFELSLSAPAWTEEQAQRAEHELRGLLDGSPGLTASRSGSVLQLKVARRSTGLPRRPSGPVAISSLT